MVAPKRYSVNICGGRELCCPVPMEWVKLKVIEQVGLGLSWDEFDGITQVELEINGLFRLKRVIIA